MISDSDFISSINSVLKHAGLLEAIQQDSSVFVGGSLPSYVYSQLLSCQSAPSVLPCNDIDLYTNNYVKTLCNLSKHFGNKMGQIKRTGVNVTFTLLNNETPIQIVTSEFVDFHDDVLENYDTTLVAIGYHPSTQKVIIHNRFLGSLKTKQFLCYYEKSNPKRIEKLMLRAKEWYDAELIIVKENEDANFRPYYKGSHFVNSLQDIVSPPNYVQLYYQKYTCVRCNVRQDRLLCLQCIEKVVPQLTQTNQTKGKKIVILGGKNGFGKILAQEALQYNNQVCVTSRTTDTQSNIYQYVLGESVSDELMQHIITADILVLNAYSTLDGNESIWTTVLDTFDESLAYEKFKVNTIGYVKEQYAQKVRYINVINNIWFAIHSLYPMGATYT